MDTWARRGEVSRATPTRRLNVEGKEGGTGTWEGRGYVKKAMATHGLGVATRGLDVATKHKPSDEHHGMLSG